MRDVDAIAAEEFVRRQSDFQIGDFRGCEGGFRAAFQREAGNRSNLFGLFDPESGTIEPARRFGMLEVSAGPPIRVSARAGAKLPPKLHRSIAILNELSAHGLARPVAIDMQDAVANRDSLLPVFQYNRLRNAANCMLWPLARYHDFADSRFAGPPEGDDLTLRQKEPTLFWRGGPSGYGSFGGRRIYISDLVSDYVNGRTPREAFVSQLETVPRYMFVKKYFGKSGFDIGFVLPRQWEHFQDIPEIGKYCVPSVSPQEQLQFRYLMQISGNDVATSFTWQSLQNSLLLRETYDWEIFLDCHFWPGLSYIPVPPGFDLLPDIIAWADAHPDACERIVRRCRAAREMVASPEVRETILAEVVERYNKAFDRLCAGRA